VYLTAALVDLRNFISVVGAFVGTLLALLEEGGFVTEDGALLDPDQLKGALLNEDALVIPFVGILLVEEVFVSIKEGLVTVLVGALVDTGDLVVEEKTLASVGALLETGDFVVGEEGALVPAGTLIDFEGTTDTFIALTGLLLDFSKRESKP
jgi:hypothetical protein